MPKIPAVLAMNSAQRRRALALFYLKRKRAKLSRTARQAREMQELAGNYEKVDSKTRVLTEDVKQLRETARQRLEEYHTGSSAALRRSERIRGIKRKPAKHWKAAGQEQSDVARVLWLLKNQPRKAKAVAVRINPMLKHWNPARAAEEIENSRSFRELLQEISNSCSLLSSRTLSRMLAVSTGNKRIASIITGELAKLQTNEFEEITSTSILAYNLFNKSPRSFKKADLISALEFVSSPEFAALKKLPTAASIKKTEKIMAEVSKYLEQQRQKEESLPEVGGRGGQALTARRGKVSN